MIAPKFSRDGEGQLIADCTPEWWFKQDAEGFAHAVLLATVRISPVKLELSRNKFLLVLRANQPIYAVHEFLDDLNKWGAARDTEKALRE